MNLGIIKSFKSEKKTTLLSWRNQHWKTVKADTDKKQKQIINTYHNDQHPGIKRTNLCKSEISVR